MLRRFVASKVFVMLLRELIVHDHTSMILLTVKVILSLDALNLHLGCVWSEAYCYETVILLCGVTGKMQALGQQERNVRSAMKRSANGNSRFTGTRVAFIGNSPWVAKSLQSLLFCIERKSMFCGQLFSALMEWKTSGESNTVPLLKQYPLKFCKLSKRNDPQRTTSVVL